MFRPLFLVAALIASPALAAEQGGKIVMTGTASVSAKPDLAIVSAGVMTTADSARTALAENSKRMSQVFAALRDIDVEERDITTSSFNISPNWEHGPTGSRQRGYQVSNQVTVRLRDVTFVGAALDTLVRAGANQAGNVQFVVQDRDTVLDSARAEAVKKARSRATLYAEAAGVALGPILEIVEGGSSGLQEPMFAGRAVAMESAAPVAAGEQDLSVSVTITWALSGD
jgi:uncharacterized protein YggE